MQSLSLVDEWVGPHGVPGVGVAVWSGGEIVAERYVGEARSAVPVTRETLFPLASVTKPISAATFMALVDEGDISLDEPVGRILPEFRAGPAARSEGVNRRWSACARQSVPGSCSVTWLAYLRISVPATRCTRGERRLRR